MICNYAGFRENATKQNPDLKIYKIIFLKIFYEPKTLIFMIKYPTFDRSIRLHIQFFDEKFLPEQFVFILPITINLFVYIFWILTPNDQMISVFGS